MNEVHRAAIEYMGRCYGACDIIVRLGRRKLGEPNCSVVTELETLMELEHVERMVDRVFDGDATSWEDLLATPYVPLRRRPGTLEFL
jgi:hypothetical protein